MGVLRGDGKDVERPIQIFGQSRHGHGISQLAASLLALNGWHIGKSLDRLPVDKDFFGPAADFLQVSIRNRRIKSLLSTI